MSYAKLFPMTLSPCYENQTKAGWHAGGAKKAKKATKKATKKTAAKKAVRCSAKTASGKRCKHTTTSGKRCGHHKRR